VNAAGHRHIRSSYYSGTKLSEDGPWGWSKSYSYLVLQPSYLLVDYNGNPTAKKTVLELADGLLAHGRPDAAGRVALPSAIHYASDRDGIATRIRLPWPLFWAAWKWTGEHRYLAPIFGGGPGALSSVNANALDLLDLRKSWPTSAADAPQRGESQVEAHLAWQVSGDKRHLESLYARQIESAALREYINTEGSLWIDRVDVPHAELQRARLGGVALVRNGLFPGHALSWRFEAPASDQSLAILVPDATPTALKIIAYNLEAQPVRAALTGWNVEPGVWDVAQGLDGDGDDVADSSVSRAVKFERTRSLELSFPPRATTIVTLKLKTPGTPYWNRPDLGIDTEDVTVENRLVRVRVHSLGSIDAPSARLVVRTRDGALAASAMIPALAAPLDLLPRTTWAELRLPPGADPSGATIEIDPDHTIEEITEANNSVRLDSAFSARAAAPLRASPAPPAATTRNRR
jgi:hypothetical protein